jgi:hypothetical protein
MRRWSFAIVPVSFPRRPARASRSCRHQIELGRSWPGRRCLREVTDCFPRLAAPATVTDHFRPAGVLRCCLGLLPSDTLSGPAPTSSSPISRRRFLFVLHPPSRTSLLDLSTPLLRHQVSISPATHTRSYFLSAGESFLQRLHFQSFACSEGAEIARGGAFRPIHI